jgi:dTDP-4-dehydrorhamnose 3,5-epimerase
MVVRPARLNGVARIEIEPIVDERGFFARSLCARELEAAGIGLRIVQCNISVNRARGTLRGMHSQVSPFAEAKLVRCTAGSIFDVVVDLREDSATYLEWEAFELTSVNRTTLYIPAGFAHGFQTLEDNSEVFYQMSEFYSPEHARGVPWNDPTIGIEWPVENPIVSQKDGAYRPVRP